jgi:hypothetical protein
VDGPRKKRGQSSTSVRDSSHSNGTWSNPPKPEISSSRIPNLEKSRTNPNPKHRPEPWFWTPESPQDRNQSNRKAKNSSRKACTEGAKKRRKKPFTSTILSFLKSGKALTKIKGSGSTKKEKKRARRSLRQTESSRRQSGPKARIRSARLMANQGGWRKNEKPVRARAVEEEEECEVLMVESLQKSEGRSSEIGAGEESSAAAAVVVASTLQKKKKKKKKKNREEEGRRRRRRKRGKKTECLRKCVLVSHLGGHLGGHFTPSCDRIYVRILVEAAAADRKKKIQSSVCM